MYNECEWTTLSQRRHQHKISFMHNVNTDIVPSYIHYLIPLLVSAILDYSPEIIIHVICLAWLTALHTACFIVEKFTIEK